MSGVPERIDPDSLPEGYGEGRCTCRGLSMDCVSAGHLGVHPGLRAQRQEQLAAADTVELRVSRDDLRELFLTLTEDRYRMDKSSDRPLPQPRWAANVRISKAVNAALEGECARCHGSGVDPEHSSPGCTDPDRGAEPPNLEPCVACQYPAGAPQSDVNDAAWHSVWVHGAWVALTRNLTSEEREHAADCVARERARLNTHDDAPEPGGLRWWRDPSQTN
jgi:hypothetical protein